MQFAIPDIQLKKTKPASLLMMQGQVCQFINQLSLLKLMNSADLLSSRQQVKCHHN